MLHSSRWRTGSTDTSGCTGLGGSTGLRGSCYRPAAFAPSLHVWWPASATACAAGPAAQLPEQPADTAASTGGPSMQPQPDTRVQRDPGARTGPVAQADPATTVSAAAAAGVTDTSGTAAQADSTTTVIAAAATGVADTSGGAAQTDLAATGTSAVAVPTGSAVQTDLAAAGASDVAAATGAVSSPSGRFSYRLLLAYDGTAYSGWQLQPSAPTIQLHMEAALQKVLQEPRQVLAVLAAGRTDSGVHAEGQVVQFRTNKAELDLQRLRHSLNKLLPPDIRVFWVRQTAPDFNVTCCSTFKTYHYYVDTGEVAHPLRLRTWHHTKVPLDLPAMRSGAALLTGTHDFTQFSNISHEGRQRNPVKQLMRFDVVEVPGGLRFEVQGSGFLYKQVRHMVGALLALGQGALSLQDIRARLELGSSQLPGQGGKWRGYNVAPANGLQLYQVEYPAAVDDPSQLLFPDLPHDPEGRLLFQGPNEALEAAIEAAALQLPG